MRNLGFAILQKFQTPVQKFDFNLFKFELKFKNANIQYYSYLVKLKEL
jgi:hypothetical protein